MALLTAGAIAKLIDDSINVKCIIDIESSIEQLVDAFESWEGKNYKGSMDYLRNGLKDIVSALEDCSGEGGSWWDKVTGVIKKVADYFFPEVVAAYEIVVRGVDVYDDFSGMMHSCSDEVHDYIDCGADLGDLVYQVWKTF